MGIRPTSKRNNEVSSINKHIGTSYDNVAIVADNIDAILEAVDALPTFLQYLGPSTVPPTKRQDGTSLKNGDYYLDTGINAIVYYDEAEALWFSVDPVEVLNARNEAIAARDAAVVAKDEAETAQAETETLKNETQGFRDTASTASANAQASKVATEGFKNDAEDSAILSDASANDSSSSAQEARTHEINAQASANSASNSASQALTHKNAAASSASAASTSETNAKDSETVSSTNAATAITKASEAATSASTASTKAAQAVTSASNAATSEANANTSKNDAQLAESNAASSASAARASELNAASSESISMANANFKGEWTDLTGSLSIPASVLHANAIWMLTTNLGNVTASEPSAVNDDWTQIATTGGAATDSQRFGGELPSYYLDPDNLDDSGSSNKWTTQAEINKLSGIESGATGDQTGAEIKSLYEAEADTNAFTDAEKTLVSTASQPGDNISSFNNDAGYVTSADIVSGVSSVNGETGVVVIDYSDVGAGGLAEHNTWTGSNTFSDLRVSNGQGIKVDGATGGNTIDFDAVNPNGAQAFNVRFGRDTTANGGVARYFFYTADGTANNPIILQPEDETIYVGNHKVYHEGNKPDTTDVGLSGLSMLANDVLLVRTDFGDLQVGAGNADWAHFTTDRDKFYFNKQVEAENLLKIYATNTWLSGTEGRINNNRIYHEGNKPTATEIGALNKSGDTVDGVLTLGEQSATEGGDLRFKPAPNSVADGNYIIDVVPGTMRLFANSNNNINWAIDNFGSGNAYFTVGQSVRLSHTGGYGDLMNLTGNLHIQTFEVGADTRLFARDGSNVPKEAARVNSNDDGDVQFMTFFNGLQRSYTTASGTNFNGTINALSGNDEGGEIVWGGDPDTGDGNWVMDVWSSQMRMRTNSPNQTTWNFVNQGSGNCLVRVNDNPVVNQKTYTNPSNVTVKGSADSGTVRTVCDMWAAGTKTLNLDESSFNTGDEVVVHRMSASCGNIIINTDSGTFYRDSLNLGTQVTMNEGTFTTIFRKVDSINWILVLHQN